MSARSSDAEPDLELTAGLAADDVRLRIMDAADVQTAGGCAVVGSELRIGSPEKIEAGRCYRNVAVEKRLLARVVPREWERAVE
jgi:hypothetical protein